MIGDCRIVLQQKYNNKGKWNTDLLHQQCGWAAIHMPTRQIFLFEHPTLSRREFVMEFKSEFDRDRFVARWRC